MNIQRLFHILGPGIIWAATSIGVSHIVQATRAGANFGFALLGFIVLAHVIKYPFFLFGPKYSALTGKSLLDGYRNVGQWALVLFLTLTFMTMFFIMAGVTLVTSALAVNLFGQSISVSQYSIAILIVVVSMLLIGKYALLNAFLKWMMIVFAIVSVLAWLLAVNQLGFMPESPNITIDLTSAASIAFIVALMGWMPTAIEVSVWHSLWTTSRFDTFGKKQSKIAQLDFNIAYIICLILAIIFMWLGALLMFGDGSGFSSSSAKFAAQLVDLYANSLGQWSWLIMAFIAFIALFSTTFAVADGFSNVWKRSMHIYLGPDDQSRKGQHTYVVILLVLCIGSWFLISQYISDIKALLDFATTISFVSAPLYAWLNYKVIMSNEVDSDDKPKGLFKWYTLLSLLALTAFSIYYVVWRYF